MGVIIGIILGLLFIGAAIWGGMNLVDSGTCRETIKNELHRSYRNLTDEEVDSLSKRAKVCGTRGRICIIASIVLLFTFIFVPFSIRKVDTGEVAVVKYFGDAREVRTSGTYFDFWIANKYEIYDAKVQDLEVSTMAYSKDAQTMDILMTVQYQIDDSRAIQIAKQYGSMDVLANRIISRCCNNY